MKFVVIVPFTFWKVTALLKFFQPHFENVCSNDMMNKMKLKLLYFVFLHELKDKNPNDQKPTILFCLKYGAVSG